MVHARTIVLARRRTVTSMLVRGMPPSEIAETLHVKKETVYNDIRVIRSGKNNSLYACTREEIVAQLFLNAQERSRFLWETAENTDKDHVKVRSMQELRQNDERIIARLSDPKVNPYFTPEFTDEDIQEWVDKYDALRMRVEQVEKRHIGREAELTDQIRRLRAGEMEYVRKFHKKTINDNPDRHTSG